MAKAKNYPRGSISRSSVDSNMAYLHAIWKGRVNLNTPERTGFAQAFYVFINTHLEGRLFALIDLRLEAIRQFSQEASHDIGYRLAAIYKNDQVKIREREADSHPAYYSIHKMVDEKYENLKSAAASRLIQIYDSVFQQPFRVVIGEELKKDLDALTSMRNIFAHGRRVSIDFEGIEEENRKADFSTSTLRLAAERLQHANLLSNTAPISTKTYHEWELSIFSDDALLYFYDKIMQIDVKLKYCPCSIREKEMISRMPNLPVLSRIRQAQDHGLI